MNPNRIEEAALSGLQAEEIAADLSSIVQVPSVTGGERDVVERLRQIVELRGLEAEVHEHDLDHLRAQPGYPGEEAERDELVGLTAAMRGSSREAPRICLNGHIDVVNPGTVDWERAPFSGEIEDGMVHGRGSVDMKGGVVAALHAMAAVRRAAGRLPGDVVLQAVPSEEDGGAGTFAALQRDADFDACIIPEPTGFKVCCAQAGALTFRGTVRGVSAHAAMRLEGVSAIDRYIPIHQALHEHERRINEEVEHELMAELPLPYPILVGQLEAGEWSSQVPDRLMFEGRVGVRVGESAREAREAVEREMRAACEDVEIEWTGGQFSSGETAADHPLVEAVRGSVRSELGKDLGLTGVPYGADMRLFTERGIPCAMVGTGGLELLHAVDERVKVPEVLQLSRTITRALVRMQPTDTL